MASQRVLWQMVMVLNGYPVVALLSSVVVEVLSPLHVAVAVVVVTLVEEEVYNQHH